MTTLTICKTEIGGEILENDYTVKEDGYGCGRIRLGFMAGAKPKWLWFVNPPLPVPAAYTGTAGSFEAAKAQFKVAWEDFRATLTPERVAHWHELEDSVRERFAGG